MTEAVGWFAMVITLVLASIGLGSQIYKNHKRSSTEGLSFPFFILSLLTWCAWAVYGWIKNDSFIAFAQSFGAIMAFVIFLQFFVYRNKRP